MQNAQPSGEGISARAGLAHNATHNAIATPFISTLKDALGRKFGTIAAYVKIEFIDRSLF
ncbi:MAG: hypothetical protein WD229_00155 [Pirellulales bacterium]